MKIPGSNCEFCPLKDILLGGPNHLWYAAPRGDEGLVDLMIVGEGPGAQEARKGTVFVGPSGELLQKVMDMAIRKKTKVWITNAALCFPGKDGDKELSIQFCKGHLQEEIRNKNPQVIITLGNLATQAILGEGVQGITKERGKIRKLNNAWVMPTYHPAAVLRNPSWYRDLCDDFQSALRYIVREEESVQVGPAPVQYEVTEDWAKVLRSAERSMYATLDLETTGLTLQDVPFLVAIGTGEGVYLLPESVLGNPNFLEVLPKAHVAWVGHNAGFDLKMLRTIGTSVRFKFDTFLADYLQDERHTAGLHDLKSLAQRIWGAPNWEEPVALALKRAGKGATYQDVPTEILYPYAANDAYWTYKLAEYEGRLLLENRKFRWIFDNLLMPGMHALAEAELRGVQIDQPLLHSTISRYEKICSELEEKLQKLSGLPNLNPRSTKQVAGVLYDRLGIKEVNGQGRSTNAPNVLERIHGVPFVDTLLEYRTYHKLFSTYLKGLQRDCDEGGRVHTHFNLAGTTTGRLSSDSPNLQNIPSRGDLAKDIKNLFLADQGYVFGIADLSQIELRMIALLSRDPWLIDVYKSGRDLHGEMAATLWGEYDKEQRSFAKRLNFGLVYGRSVLAIANDGMYDLSMTEADRIHRMFFDRMPGVRAWQKDVEDFVRVHKYVESILGRRRRFPMIPTDRKGYGEMLRESWNHVPQSGASDITLLAFIRLHGRGFDPRITVHDSINTMLERETAEEALREQIKIMEQAGYDLYGNDIPIIAEGEVSERWT